MKFDFKKFLAVVGQVGPIILAATPGGEKIPKDLIGKIVGAIGEAQEIKGASGPDKKAHVLKVLAAGVDVANATGRVNLDGAAINSVASAGIDNVIATVHIIQGSKVAVEPGATAPAVGAAAGVEQGGIAGDTGEHASHGHGSGDNLKK